MKSNGEHRRGRSMGGAPPPTTRSGEKDEDLALFHEMKRREKHNFLHPSPDDLDATLSSKFGGMGAPTKKPGTDLLTSESDKNDYDWLLTPPGTPLFPSLDQEAAALAVLSPALSNGSYSSASSATKSLKSSTYSPAESVKGSRGNPSPRRQTSTSSSTPNGISRSRSSPGPAAILTRPSTPTPTGATRPSTPTSKSTTPAVRSSTPNLKLTISHSAKSYSNSTTPTGTRPSTPTPRSSTPTTRPSTPGGRSSTPTSKPSTPTMRRSLSGGRTGITSPSPTTTRGGPSPKRSTSASRGNSPSAKRITSVITSIAGMSSEAPPNLRTTMPERSTSNGKSGHSNGSNYSNVEDSAQSRRRPRSPSVARSFSSSSSQEQRTSSQTSRGSVVSSYDDGLEVNRPASYGSGRNSATGKWHATGHDELLTGKVSTYGKRVTKSSSSRENTGYGVASSKKSSDLVKRPVDAYQNSPASAYRHLHSSSPVSPFYSTRTNSLLLRAGVAMNSSLTTSSNASSEHGTTVAADTEGSERDDDDLLSWDSYGRRASMSPRLQQADILVLDKDEEKTVPWQDSLFERANSHGPSSSHSQGSQSTLDAEVTGFYETDGIASLEMLEQLGVMGENYQFKKSSSSKMRSSGKRASITEDVKVANLNEYGVPRISPSKIYQEGQGNPALHLTYVPEKQEFPERRDFDPKIPAQLVFQESLGSPTRHLGNSEKQQEIPERPRKSRDFESRTSPHRRLSLEGQGSPSRRLPQLEKQDSLERPRRSRDFESKTSPHRRFSLEGGQGSPSRRLSALEKQDTLERPRSSRDFETELMRRSSEKLLGVGELQVPSSEIRAACLFVRDFKVGLLPSHNLDSPRQAQDISPEVKRQGIEEVDKSLGLKRRGIEEVEIKLRDELSYDWDKSVETVEQPIIGLNGDTERRLSDSPILVSRPRKTVGGIKSSARLSLEFPFTSADTVYQTKMDSLTAPAMSKHLGAIDAIESDLTPLKDVELDHPISVNGTPTNAEIDDSSVCDGAMDESETETPSMKEIVMDCPIPLEVSRPTAMDFNKFDLQRAAIRDTLQFTSQLLGIQSDLSDDGVYAMDEDVGDVHCPEDGTTASVSEDELVVLEESMKGGHVHIMEEQGVSPMDVDEFNIAFPENREGDKLGRNDDNFLQAGIEQEALHEEAEILQSSEEDAASEGLCRIRHSEASNEQGVVEEVDDIWFSQANNQQDVVESFLRAVPLSVDTNGSKVMDRELCYGEDVLDAIGAESDGVHVSERQVEQGVYSNGNHLLPNSKSASMPDKESISHFDTESVLTNMTDDQSPHKLPGNSCKFPSVDVKEIFPSNLQLCSASIEDNQESAVYECYTSSVDHAQKDLAGIVVSDGTHDPVVEQVISQESQDVVNGISDANKPQEQRYCQSPKYVDGDFVAPMDETGDRAGYNEGNKFFQEELQISKYCKPESVKQLIHLSAAKENVEFLRKDVAFLKAPSDEAQKKDTDFLSKKQNEFEARCVENQQLYYAVADVDIHEPGSSQSDVLDVSPRSEDIGEVPTPKPEFRSASTLCAALEEQIAGLIQKIDSAIEESSKPFSASPQESLLVKDKRSILETQQDECTGSLRSSQEEDLIDMLWAEDGETSSSEESREQDFLNSKDCSQREMNGVVRSSRLSDRGLPTSVLGQSNDGYDAVVRTSRSDLGIEKRMSEVSSKRCAVLPLEQLDDVVHMHSREPMKSPLKIPLKSPLKSSMKSPLKSPGKSPFMWSREMNAHESLAETHFPLDAQSKADKSSEEGGQATPDGEVWTALSGRQHGCDILESSSGYVMEERTTDAQLLALCNGGERTSTDADKLKNSSAILVFPKVEAGPVEIETVDTDAAISEERPREAAESLADAERARPAEDAALQNASRELDMSNIMSIGDSLALEARDQATPEQPHNRDRDEFPVLTSARSELSSQVENGVPNDEWLHRKNMFPKAASSGPVPSVGPLVQEPALELEEPRRFNGPETEVMGRRLSSAVSSEFVDPTSVKEGTTAEYDNLLSHVDIGCVQAPEEVDVHPLRLSSQNDLSLIHTSLVAGSVDEPGSSPRKQIVEETEVMPNGVSNGIIVSSQFFERNSPVHGLETNARAEVEKTDLVTGQQWQQRSPRGRVISPNISPVSPRGSSGRSHGCDELLSEGTSASKSQASPRGGPGRFGTSDESPSEAAAVVQEIWMSRGRLDCPPFANGSGEGQHISIVSGNAISRAQRDSFRMEEDDSGAELGRQDISVSTDVIGRENVSSEAHQEVTRLSVIRSGRDLPALNLKSPSQEDESSEEIQAHHEDLGVSPNGNEDLAAKEHKDTSEGNQSVKRLPISKAKSVRTISLSPKSRTRSPAEEPSSPEGEVHPPHNCDAYTNITVVSPESLQWDHNSPVETPTKTRSSPASLSRNMTLAEATDTILYCSSLMHTIVYKAAAYAIEKEELAALASTPISSGEVPHYPGVAAVVSKEGNDPQVDETGSCKLQGVNDGPPSVRRALSYAGHQTAPLTPADTSLQIPVDQVIENVHAPEAAPQTASPVNRKNDIIPVKVSKAKCGCTVM